MRRPFLLACADWPLFVRLAAVDDFLQTVDRQPDLLALFFERRADDVVGSGADVSGSDPDGLFERTLDEWFWKINPYGHMEAPMHMKSVMSHQFSQVPKANIQRSTFDRSHGYKTTFNAGYLIPFYVDEALPGDTFNMKCTTFARLATPLHPIMDNIYADVFFFAVPYRLVWTHFVNFFGEQANPTDSTSYLVPQFSAYTAAAGSLSDYMGIPTAIANIQHNSLHMRAYNLVWNQWFRDQNLQNSVTVDMGDGPDSIANYVILQRGKRHDYFTSALPWPQKGPAVSVPIGTSATVKTSSTDLYTGAQNALRMLTSPTGAAPTAAAALQFGTAGNSNFVFETTTAGGGANNVSMYPSNLYADLSTATATTINQLRQAFQIQRIYERDARGGTRYTELIRSHFGVISPDARLQRAEYLGGGSTRVNINPIAQTQGTGASGTTTPQGNLAAMGTFTHSYNGFTKSFTEHCLLLGLINVRADLTYQQGLNRMWSRQTRFDFFWPSLAHIGEQAILNQELVMQGNGQDALVFGYQERFAEYRYFPSIITGQFRSNYATPLDSWHLSLNFGSTVPPLSAAWIVDAPPIARVIAVPSQPHFLLDVYFNLQCARPMPLYGVPGDIDRF